MPDYDGAQASPGATVLLHRSVVPLPGTADRTEPVRTGTADVGRTGTADAVRTGPSNLTGTARIGTLRSQTGEEPGRPVRRRTGGHGRRAHAAQPFRPAQPLPAGLAAGDVLVQPPVRHSGGLAVEAGGKCGTELDASHPTIVAHHPADRSARVHSPADARRGGRRG